ncbi:MAG: hypothetical protein E6H66_22155 [Betaproteobacteria bacterium]|nr:MAG: hypothetical protein E6H66_22155 [Betaproteobacteria bacterium]
MENLLLWIGRLAGVLGILVCAVAFGARLTGMWNLGGFQVGALLQSGMAAMILACLAYSADVAERARK